MGDYIAILVFYSIMILLYRHCTGKTKVKESRRDRYHKWVNKYGKKIGTLIIVILALHAFGLIVQVAEVVARG